MVVHLQAPLERAVLVEAEMGLIPLLARMELQILAGAAVVRFITMLAATEVLVLSFLDTQMVTLLLPQRQVLQL